MANDRTNMILEKDRLISEEPFAINGKFQILCAMPELPFVYATAVSTYANAHATLAASQYVLWLGVGDNEEHEDEFRALTLNDTIVLEATPYDGTADVVYRITGGPPGGFGGHIEFDITLTSGTLVVGKTYKAFAVPANSGWGSRVVTLQAKSPHPGDIDNWIDVVDPKTGNTIIQWTRAGFIEVEGSKDLVYRMKTTSAGPQASLNVVRNWVSSKPGR